MATILYVRPTPEIKYLVWFMMTFTSMQLVDAVIWYSLRNKNDTLNRIFSQFVIPIVLAAELLVAYYAAKYYIGWSNRIFEVLLWIIVIFLIFSWIRDCMNPITKPNTNGNLVWCNHKFGHLPRVIFFVALMLPFALAYPNGWIKTAALTWAFASWIWNYSNPAFGSRWCWASNIFALFVLAIVLLGKK
jgi:hypothetical protein